MKKKPVIELEDDDFGAVLNYAVRYCIGRRTYGPHLTMDFIRPLIPYLSKRTLDCMKNDIRAARSLGDENIDKPVWERFLKEVWDEIERRENE